MQPTDASDEVEIGRAAFIAGYPLLTTLRTMQTFAQLVGVNRLFVGKALVSPTSRLVVAPNRDTIYAIAVLDLRNGPLVLTLPDLSDRYHVFQLIDAWMGDFGLIGTRTTQGRPGSWLIRGPHSTSAGPAGLHRLDSPTNQAFLLGRIRALDDTDATAAAALGRGARLEPLDPAAPPLPAMAPPPGSAQSVGSNGIAVFDELGDALAVNAPVTHAQRAAIDRVAKLGVGPGRRPGAEQSGSSVAALGTAVTEGLHELAHPTNLGGHRANGWDVNLHLGERRDTAGLATRRVDRPLLLGSRSRRGGRIPTRDRRQRRSTARRFEAVPHPLQG